MRVSRCFLMAVVLGVSLAGCAVRYTLVRPGPVPVAKGSMRVSPGLSWNKASNTGSTMIDNEESWTLNGPALDEITFIGAVHDGEAIAKQRPKDDRKVPVFHADMTPQDLVSMVEALYRIKGNVKIFEATAVTPVTFLGRSGVQFDYAYVGKDQVKRRGRSVLAVVNGKLYLIALDGTAVHYFESALPEFQAIVTSASMS